MRRGREVRHGREDGAETSERIGGELLVRLLPVPSQPGDFSVATPSAKRSLVP